MFVIFIALLIYLGLNIDSRTQSHGLLAQWRTSISITFQAVYTETIACKPWIMVSTMSKTPLTKGDKNRIRKRADVDVNLTYFQEVQVQLIPPGTTTPPTWVRRRPCLPGEEVPPPPPWRLLYNRCCTDTHTSILVSRVFKVSKYILLEFLAA